MLRTWWRCAGCALVSLAACGGRAGQPSSAGADRGTGAGEDGAADAGNEQSTGVHYRFLSIIQPPACLPQVLAVDAQGFVACTVFVVLPAGSACASWPGLVGAPAAAADAVVARSGSPQSSTVCVLAQLGESERVNGTCTASTRPGWCYVTDPPGQQCPQAITFSPGTPPAGAEVMLGCD